MSERQWAPRPDNRRDIGGVTSGTRQSGARTDGNHGGETFPGRKTRQTDYFYQGLNSSLHSLDQRENNRASLFNIHY